MSSSVSLQPPAGWFRLMLALICDTRSLFSPDYFGLIYFILFRGWVGHMGPGCSQQSMVCVMKKKVG